MGAITISHAQSLSRNSFSGSLIARSLSKFHSVRVSDHKPTPPIAKAVVPPKVDVRPADPPAPIIKTLAPPPAPKVAAVPVGKTTKTAQSPRVLTDEDLDKIADKVVDAVAGPMADPSKIGLVMPDPEPAKIMPFEQKGSRNLHVQWVSEGYFDAGYERLLGTFATQILRFGARYGQDDLHAYVRNETLDTVGTGLPYPQSVTGTSVGLEARHWFPGNQMYASASLGQGISGPNEGKADARYGLAGYTNWTHDRWFGDFYGELFYIALATDTFLDGRLRAGRIWKRFKKDYVWGYVVGQFWVSGQTESGTENRMEAGLGVGYSWHEGISLNIELRGGYAFRSGIDDGGDRLYFNPTIILAGGFYNGYTPGK